MECPQNRDALGSSICLNVLVHSIMRLYGDDVTAQSVSSGWGGHHMAAIQNAWSQSGQELHSRHAVLNSLSAAVLV